MKQYNIFGKVDLIHEIHPQFKDKIINENYFGSDLNRFTAEECKKDMVVNNIDLIINDYKKNNIKIIESKHTNEELKKGQQILLSRLSKLGIDTFCVSGEYPYITSVIYSFQTRKAIKVNQEQLIRFLNNK